MDETRSNSLRAAELGRLRQELLRKIIENEVRRRRARGLAVCGGDATRRWPSEPVRQAVACVN